VIYQDEQMWLIRDPLELTDYQLILPPALAQMLIFVDGSRTLPEIQAAFAVQFGASLPFEVLEETLATLDDAYLLANERSKGLIEGQLQEYRSLPFRPSTLASMGYPEDPVELRAALAEFEQGDKLADWKPWSGRGIISPHIDYHRGGPVYAQVWRRAQAAVQEADLVLIFGTDHNGSPGSITLTQTPYVTPYGILPTDLDLVNDLVDEIGPDLFDEELHHRKEHSVELSAVWYHHIRGEEPCPVVPILCGSFHHFIMNGHQPQADPKLNAFVETLLEKTAGKKVLTVASVDLAHVGPAFGDDFFMNALRREELTRDDKSLMEAIAQGDAERFFSEVASVEDRHRICGFSSIYLMLRYLGPTKGLSIAYEHCPADRQDTSLVSICGMLLE
jgi:AmmeMemoRadiSam system protein B